MVNLASVLNSLLDLAPAYNRVKAAYEADLDPEKEWGPILWDESVDLAASLPADHLVIGVKFLLFQSVFVKRPVLKLDVKYRGGENSPCELLPPLFDLEGFLVRAEGLDLLDASARESFVRTYVHKHVKPQDQKYAETLSQCIRYWDKNEIPAQIGSPRLPGQRMPMRDVAKAMFPVEPLPDGAKPIYVKDPVENKE